MVGLSVLASGVLAYGGEVRRGNPAVAGQAIQRSTFNFQRPGKSTSRPWQPALQSDLRISWVRTLSQGAVTCRLAIGDTAECHSALRGFIRLNPTESKCSIFSKPMKMDVTGRNQAGLAVKSGRFIYDSRYRIYGTCVRVRCRTGRRSGGLWLAALCRDAATGVW